MAPHVHLPCSTHHTHERTQKVRRTFMIGVSSGSPTTRRQMATSCWRMGCSGHSSKRVVTFFSNPPIDGSPTASSAGFASCHTNIRPMGMLTHMHETLPHGLPQTKHADTHPSFWHRRLAAGKPIAPLCLTLYTSGTPCPPLPFVRVARMCSRASLMRCPVAVSSSTTAARPPPTTANKQTYQQKTSPSPPISI